MTTERASRNWLLPCPFCGEKAKFHDNGIGDSFVMCSGCNASTSDVRCETNKQAAERWNLRAPRSESAPLTAEYDPVSQKCRGDCDCSIGQTCKAYLAYKAKRTDSLTSPHPAPNASEPRVPNGEYRELQLGGNAPLSASRSPYHLEANNAAYRVYCNALAQLKYVAWRDVQECIQAYLNAAGSSSVALDNIANQVGKNDTIERPKDFDAALERIDANCREVQVLCDEFDIDPYEYLASDEAPVSAIAPLKWLEDNSTLHQRVEILYVVDGYEVQVMHEDGVTELSPRFHGATLAEAISAATDRRVDKP